MKRFNLSNIVGTTVLAMSLAIVPTVLPASAQTTAEPEGVIVTNEADNQLTDGNYADGDWGLLGLLGLFGLFGRKSRRHDDTAYGNRDVVGSSRSNF